MLLLFFFHTLLAYNLNCSARTKIYENHGRNNYDGYYFITKSYNNLDVCKSLNNDNYMSYINKTCNCTGVHCVNNSWTGYNVEHIIPTNNNISYIQGCNTEISGNFIMAYDKWIRALGNNFFYERLLIYNDIYLNAYTSIYWCCKHQTPWSHQIPAYYCLPQ